jgi:hypothetical protein
MKELPASEEMLYIPIEEVMPQFMRNAKALESLSAEFGAVHDAAVIANFHQTP